MILSGFGCNEPIDKVILDICICFERKNYVCSGIFFEGVNKEIRKAFNFCIDVASLYSNSESVLIFLFCCGIMSVSGSR
jgi:hypothetical protein